MLLSEIMDLPASEINYWKAYYSIFPFPQERADARAANIVATMLNVNRTKATDKIWSTSDVLPDYLGEKQSMTIEDVEQQFVKKALEAGFAVMENKDDHST